MQLILIFTGVFNGFIRENLERVFSKSLNGSCHISDIKGKWNYFLITGIKVKSQNLDADILEGEIKINLPMILFKKINISRLNLDSINVFIKKNNGESLTVQDTAINFNIEEGLKNISFSINASEISLRKINIYYDTLFIKDIDIKAVLSLNRKRGYLLYRVDNCDVNGIINLKGTNGEFGIKSDSLFHKGTVISDVFTLENFIVYRDKELLIRKADIEVKAENYSLLKHIWSLSGNVEISGSLSKESRTMTVQANFKRLEADSLLFEKIIVNVNLKNDTVKIEKFECADLTFPMKAKGVIEISPVLNAEFDICLEGIKAEHFLRMKDVKENSFYGTLHIKSDLKNTLSLVVDSVQGFYGNIKKLDLRGAASYMNEEVCVKNGVLKIEGGNISADGSFGRKGGQLDIKVTDFPMEIITSIRNDMTVSGYVNGEIKMAGEFEDYKIIYNIEMTNAYLENNTFEYFSSNGSFQCVRNNIQKGIMQGSFINGVVFGKNVSIVYFESMKESNRIYMDIDGVSNILSFGLSAKINITNDLTKAAGEMSRLDIKTDIDEFVLKNPTYIEFGENEFYIRSFNLTSAKGYLRGNLRMSADSMNFDLSGYDENLSIIEFITGIGIKGNIEFNALGFGRRGSTLMKLDAKVKRFEFAGINVDSILLNCDYDGNDFDINYMNIIQEEKISYLYGKVNVDEKNIKNSTMDIIFNLKNIDEKFFIPLENIFTIKTKSGLSSVGKISGSIMDPKLNGEILLDSTDIYIVSLETTVKSAVGRVDIKGDSALVTELRGKTEKGNLLLTGGASLKNYMIKNYWFYILAEGVHSIGIEYVDVFANCSLDIRGDMKKVDMNGKIKITEGVSNFPFISSSNGVQSSSKSRYKSNMNLKITNDNKLWLKNNFVDAELKGDILLRKEGPKWNVTGKADVIRGYYFYLDKKFKIKNGTFELKETNKIVEPVINLLSSTHILYVDGEEKKQADVFLTAMGSAFMPTVTLYSEPALGIENIISILSFNMTVSSLSNFEEISKGVPEKALQIYLRNKYLNTISSSIKVDQLDIQTNLLGAEKSAKLSVGKYIGKKVFVSYTHDVFTFQEDVFRIEYNIIKNNDLITERDEQGYFNTGLQFKYRF